MSTPWFSGEASVHQWATGRETPELLGDLRGPSFDYLIWTAIGLPMLMVVVLVILLAPGAFTNSR